MNIELPILGLLRQKPMHGYELMRQFETLLGFAWQPSYGALYPMLRKLEQREFVTGSGVQQERGPQRQAYSVTDQGLTRLRTLLVSTRAHTELPVQVLFLDELSAEERDGLLRRARQQKARALERLETELAERAESVSKYQRLVMEYGIATLKHGLAWLEELKRQ